MPDINVITDKIHPYAKSMELGKILGLADTIKKYSPDTGRGYGFVFQEYSTKALLNQIKQAIQFFHNKDVWKKLMSRAMKVEFTWEKAAEKYVELYRKLVE